MDNIEGPVMVIAGPGTGKTQILAARIGKILLETDAFPENILCLTFTDAGAIAMRRRLIGFIGADAHKVHIHTFHSFCNEIIQENLSHFQKNSLDAISELQSIDLFRKLIDAFPKDHLLKRYRGDVYWEINNLKDLFNTMKKEGWPPDFLNEKIDEHLEQIKTNENFIYKNTRKGQWEKGDYKPAYEEEIIKIEKLRAAVKEFENFQKLMLTNNLYDFNDMINWVIKVFEENNNILANYQEKYQYILVDEYQDTSGTQNRLVQLLINYWDKPNVFVVGDDDQSIFRFQGANVANMQDFANSYADEIKKIVLTNNYRSTQPILDIAKTLISSNEERLVKKMEGLSKDLVSANTKINSLIHLPVVMEYETIADEMIDITNRIEVLIREGIMPGRIAIIYKEHKYGIAFAEYFKLRKIPYYAKKHIDILEHPFIKKIIQIMRWIASEHDIPYGGDEILFEILHYDFFKIVPIEIAKLTVEVNKRKYKGEDTSLRKLVYDKANEAPKDLFDNGISSQLKNVSNTLETLISDAANLTLQNIFQQIINETGILKYIMQSSEKIALMQLLTALFDFIKEETSRQPDLDLPKLMAIIELMQKEKISLPYVQVAGNEKSVNLLTAHGCKGLEFEYVFFSGANANFWEKKKSPRSGYKFPDNLFSSSSSSGKAIETEELRRLFYVALTRAEQHLYISYPVLNMDAKPLERSMFIEEILQVHDLPVEKIFLTEEEKLAYGILQFTPQAPEIEKAEEDFINSLLEKFIMNVTALNNYLNCPLAFYYSNLIRIPSGKSESLEFGSAIHYALDQLFKKMQSSENTTFFPVENMIADFEWYLHRHRENFTKESFARRMEYGHEVLINYYRTYIDSWSKIIKTEANIKAVINGIPIKGKLDKLEFTGREVNVVDYKTGDIDKALDKLKPPNDKQPNGGDYWRQAVFYKILIDNYELKGWKAISAEFDFIEPDKKKKYRKEKIVISPQDIETVKQQITEVWQKIQVRDFYIGCGKDGCHWCDFVKDNKLAVALHDIEEE